MAQFYKAVAAGIIPKLIGKGALIWIFDVKSNAKLYVCRTARELKYIITMCVHIEKFVILGDSETVVPIRQNQISEVFSD